MNPLPEIEGGFAAILADPPWRFETWSGDITGRVRAPPYETMTVDEIADLPVRSIAAKDSVLFLWGMWVMLPHALDLVAAWGFAYKSCAFAWMKADLSQMDLFLEADDGAMGTGYWTRQSSEFCLLATRGAPKRRNADVRQGIIERKRQHSRKPACVHARIERLVDGPYLELFARQTRAGWTAWGNETTRFREAAE